MDSDARRRERLRVEIFTQPDALAKAVATRIAELIRDRAARSEERRVGKEC